MDELLKLITNPVWWLTVVVAGLIINLVSSYLRDYIDKLRARFSEKWARRIMRKNADWAAEVSRLNRSKKAQEETFMNEIRYRISSVTFSILGSATLIIAFIMFVIYQDIIPFLAVLLCSLQCFAVALYKSHQAFNNELLLMSVNFQIGNPNQKINKTSP